MRKLNGENKTEVVRKRDELMNLIGELKFHQKYKNNDNKLSLSFDLSWLGRFSFIFS